MKAPMRYTVMAAPNHAGGILACYAHETDGESHKGCLLIADAREHHAGRDAHEQVGEEVGKVPEHACPVILVGPYGAYGGCEVGHKSNHRKEEAHRDYRDDIALR